MLYISPRPRAPPAAFPPPPGGGCLKNKPLIPDYQPAPAILNRPGQAPSALLVIDCRFNPSITHRHFRKYSAKVINSTNNPPISQTISQKRTQQNRYLVALGYFPAFLALASLPPKDTLTSNGPLFTPLSLSVYFFILPDPCFMRKIAFAALRPPQLGLLVS